MTCLYWISAALLLLLARTAEFCRGVFKLAPVSWRELSADVLLLHFLTFRELAPLLLRQGELLSQKEPGWNNLWKTEPMHSKLFH